MKITDSVPAKNSTGKGTDLVIPVVYSWSQTVVVTDFGRKRGWL
jgi:type IV secretory pathway TraG/TraD family ATPase VirD4